MQSLKDSWASFGVDYSGQRMGNPPTIDHGLISVIGRRRTMEDAFTVFPDFVRLRGDVHDKGKKQADAEDTSYDFFAVFDGHGSRKVSNKCKERLHHLVAEELTRKGGRVVDWQTVMATSFSRMDAEVAEGEIGGSWKGAKTVGSTALVVVLIGVEEIVVANFGDCRVVLFREGAALQLSHNVKPERPDGEGAGVKITDLILGAPSPPRSIELEVKVWKRNGRDDFLVIGTNGLWDVMPNEMVGDMVRKCFSGQVSKKVLDGVGGNCSAAAATMLTELAIARGSQDNISVIVVQLRGFDTDSSSFTK